MESYFSINVYWFEFRHLRSAYWLLVGNRGFKYKGMRFPYSSPYSILITSKSRCRSHIRRCPKPGFRV